jgi:uncharacterized protein (DUF1501 family)
VWTRRFFLKAGGIAVASLGVGGSPDFLTRAAWAVEGNGSIAGARRKVLVTIFQRGAMDGLAAVPFLGGDVLRKLRPSIGPAFGRSQAASDEAVKDLGNGFGLHPALAPLLPFWKEGSLAIVHAVGSPDPTRSHFDAQDYMESGTPGTKVTPSGWLNRAAGLLGHEATPWRAVAMTPALPRSLYGEVPAVAVTDLAQFRLSGGRPGGESAGGDFERLYDRAAQDLLRETGSETFLAMKMLRESGVDRYRPAAGADYPASPLGRSLRQIAALIKADLGLEIAFAEAGGWDTHVAQGAANGTFARRADDLARSIAAFWSDLGSLQERVVLATMTEFGRTVRENGTGGTDHGHGSCLFALGQKVAGGRVHGELRSLDVQALYEGRDLPVTTDFRSVFCALAGGHLGVTDDGKVFPGWSGKRLPLLRT